jgi:uncharacterized caspase-like protein
MSKHLSLLIAALFGCVLLTCSADSARADRRIALVVGNSNYNNPSLALSNPKNDAEDVAAALRSLGFEVVQAIDANKRDLDLSMAKFARLATDSDAALFYYAGHALQYQGRNYLMPTDAEVEDEVSLRYQMMPIDDVRAALDRASGVKVMILDACRNNPVVETLRRKASGETRALGGVRGLARIDKTQGTVIAYSTAADEVAADGQGRNSPFTTALLKRLKEPGLEIEQLFRRVASDVNTATGGRQRPETYVSLLSDYYLNQTDRTAFDTIKDSADPAALRDFINRFPTSSYASDARYRIQRIEIDAEQKQLQQARQVEAMRLLSQQSKTDQEAVPPGKPAGQRPDDPNAKVAKAAPLRVGPETGQPTPDEQRTKTVAVEPQNAAQRPPDAPAGRVDALPKLAGVERQDANNHALQNVVPAAQSPKVSIEAPQHSAASPSNNSSCDQETAKLAHLRNGTSIEELLQFERDLSCDRLRPQVARLHESLTGASAPAAIVNEAAKPIGGAAVAALAPQAPAVQRTQTPPKSPPNAPPVSATAPDQIEFCKRDESRLSRLRATQSLAEVIVFERELGCEKLRPQIVRLRESLAPANSASIAGPENQPLVEAQRSSRRIEIAAPPENEPAQQVAALPPAETEKPALSNSEIARSVKSELARVGCFNGSIDGEWNAASRRSLQLFNKNAGTKLDPKFATLGALDAVKLKSSRVCPLTCEHGYKAVGERCSRIVCAEGSFLNDDNECVKRRGRTPTASRDPDEAPHSASRPRPSADLGPAKPQSAPAKPQAAGQIVCDGRGCRPVERGCHIEFRTSAQGGPTEGGGGNVQICN